MKEKREFKEVHLKVLVWCIGGWTRGGMPDMHYKRDISGMYEEITKHHYYNWRDGRDIYPDSDQLKKLLAGEEVVLREKQWA